MALLDIDRVPRVDARVAVDKLQPLELGELRRSGSFRRSEPPAQGPARDRRGTPRDRSARRSRLPADEPAVSRLLLQSGLFLLLLRSRGAVAGRPCRGEQHLRWNAQLLAAAGFGITHVPRRRDEIPLRLAVHADRPGLRVRLHAAGGAPGRAHEDGRGRLGVLRRDAVARTAALERAGDPPRARSLSRDDRRPSSRGFTGRRCGCGGRVCRSCLASRGTAWANAQRTRPRRPARPIGDGAMSMVTRWAKSVFLSSLDGMTGGTLTVKCPDRTYRYGAPGELDATADGPRRAVLPAGADGQRHRPRRVLHGRRLDDAGPGAAGAADAAQPPG